MFEITMEITRPQDEVFARLARLEEAPRWYSAVEEVERLDDGPVRRGTLSRFTRQLGGATVENEVEVSEFEPDRAITLTSLSGPTPFTYRYRLAPSENGTLLELEGEISGEGLGGPLAMFKSFAETFFRRGMVSNLETFKRLVESA